MANPKTTSSIPLAVQGAIATIVREMKLRASAAGAISAFVTDLAGGTKLRHVSFYPAKSKGGIIYQITYTLAGKRRTERRGKNRSLALRRARHVSEVLLQVEAGILKPDDAYRQLCVDSRPIRDHVAAFERSLRAKGVVGNYADSTITRLNRCIELAGYSRLDDITRASFSRLTETLRTYADPVTRKKLSTTTINYYLKTLIQFVRWAARNDLVDRDPLQYAETLKVVTRKDRRDVLIDELGQLIASIRAGHKVRSVMAAADRAMLYLMAYGTGLRRSELRKSRVEWLNLDAKPPQIHVPAAVTKNGKEALQPLPAWLADELRAWLGDRKSGLIWPNMPKQIADLFDRDREAARAAWIEAAPNSDAKTERAGSRFLARKTSDGELVFHSLRHTYASVLVANMDLKSAQLLTRHGTVSILGDTYAHSRLEKAAAGVEKAVIDPTGGAAPGAALSDGK